MLTRVDNGVQSYFGTPFVVTGDEVEEYTEERPAMPADGLPE